MQRRATYPRFAGSAAFRLAHQGHGADDVLVGETTGWNLAGVSRPVGEGEMSVALGPQAACLGYYQPPQSGVASFVMVQVALAPQETVP